MKTNKPTNIDLGDFKKGLKDYFCLHLTKQQARYASWMLDGTLEETKSDLKQKIEEFVNAKPVWSDVDRVHLLSFLKQL